ncbi:hypothetical protein ABMA28_011361 [Loxostege sticticalis]|uniref:Uncharacterized protein n=1 Tax=Loxostege sticticalis TaxID=481309 RepID=A0ABD0S7N0_LOXSC
MWWLALLLVGARALDGADAQQPDPWGDDDDDADFYHRYHEEASSSTEAVTRTKESQYTRIRRHDQTTSPVRTLSANELKEVRDVLSKVMSGRNLSAHTQQSVTDLKKLMDIMSSTSSSDLMADLANYSPRTFLPLNEEDLQVNIARSKKKQKDKITNVTVDGVVFLKAPTHEIHWTEPKMFALTRIYHTPVNGEYICLHACVEDPHCVSVSRNWYRNYCFLFRFKNNTEGTKFTKQEYHIYYERLGFAPTTTIEPTTTTGEPTTPPDIIDIRKLVAIIANLTMNTIESNITELFNATLQKYGIPMCGDTTTTEAPIYDFANATIVAKCFVCGLEDRGIPDNAYCADAFAGDFLPLVPVDPRARGQIAKYRKYCRYLDVPGIITNSTQPRSVFGRWTGGCSVRWIDLSGIYTQRTCRNRRHAVMGKHFVSKRMAKLEMALQNEDNGCVISPMASLVPLSRGISLYARFHACVCTGSWCNGGPRVHTPVQPLHAFLTILTAWTTVALLA